VVPCLAAAVGGLSVVRGGGSVLSLVAECTRSGSQQASWLLTVNELSADPSRRRAIHARTERLFQDSETVRWDPDVRELISILHLDSHPDDN
jgi:hypothetical protein